VGRPTKPATDRAEGAAEDSGKDGDDHVWLSTSKMAKSPTSKPAE
jgi:hypothetical protein